jgi:hypothetical protein
LNRTAASQLVYCKRRASRNFSLQLDTGKEKMSQMSTKKRQSSPLPEPAVLEEEDLSGVAENPIDEPFSQEVWHSIRNGTFQF